MPYLELPDRQIYYNDTGDGPPVVLLHNGFYSSQTWDAIRDSLAENHRVIDYDRIGYGRSTHIETSLPDIDMVKEGSRELEAVLDRLDIKTASVIGHCLGGAIGLSFAARNPHRISKIVAVAVGYFGDLKRLIAADMTFVPFEQIPPILRQMLMDMHGERYAPRFWENIRHHKSSYIMTEAYDLRPTLKQLEMPLLIVNGDRDFYFEVGHPLAVYEKKRRTAELWIVPGCGHDVHMEHPDLFVRGVQRFL